MIVMTVSFNVSSRFLIAAHKMVVVVVVVTCLDSGSWLRRPYCLSSSASTVQC